MMRLIDLHKEWYESGELPSACLCWSIPRVYRNGLKLIEPSEEERLEHSKDGWEYAFWGRMKQDTPGRYNAFRQTIVLLICAINNEL